MSSYVKGDLIYEGKAKKVFSVQNHPDLVWMDYKDSLTAFNAEKKGSFAGKGKINCQIATLIFKTLARAKIPSHFISSVNEHEMICKKVKVVPLEVVIRNVLAGSTAKKFFRAEGEVLKQPLVELYYKKDEWGDPFVSDEQALFLRAMDSKEELAAIKARALEINGVLKELFKKAAITLIDFKVELGFDEKGDLILADEISPDSCRLWDEKTQEKLDKDRFRRDLGKVEESYLEVLRRLTEVSR